MRPTGIVLPACRSYFAGKHPPGLLVQPAAQSEPFPLSSGIALMRAMPSKSLIGAPSRRIGI